MIVEELHSTKQSRKSKLSHGRSKVDVQGGPGKLLRGDICMAWERMLCDYISDLPKGL